MGVIDERDLEEPEAHYPFTMSCSSHDGETIVVSDVDAVALGEAIAGGDVPTYKFILDGDADNPIGHIPDIHFAHMEAVWEYVTRDAPYYLLEGANAIRIEGVGVSMALPEADFARSLAEFGSACQRIIGDR